MFRLLLIISNVALAAPQFAPVTGANLLTGDTVSVGSGKKGTLVVFLSSRCPCSNSHVSELKALAAEHPEYKFVGVHSNRDEELSSSRDYFRTAALPFPVVQDNGGVLAGRFKALKTPHAFLFDEKGERLYAGGVSDSHDFNNADRKFLREAMDDVSKGKPVRTKEGRTLGCIIQR